MHVFERLHALRAFERQHLSVLRTIEDFNLIREIGYHEARGMPLTLKRLFLLDAGSVATVQRRLRRLRHAGLIRQRRSRSDRRAVELRLSPKLRKTYDRYGALLGGEPEAPRHICTLYASAEALAKLVKQFLADGLRKGQRCVLVAPHASRPALLDGLNDKARQVAVSDGENSARAMLSYFERQAREAKQAGSSLRVAGDMAWVRSRGLDAAQVIQLESALDALVQKLPMQILCLYDAAQFPTPTVLEALTAHRDCRRFPLPLP